MADQGQETLKSNNAESAEQRQLTGQELAAKIAETIPTISSKGLEIGDWTDFFNGGLLEYHNKHVIDQMVDLSKVLKGEEVTDAIKYSKELDFYKNLSERLLSAINGEGTKLIAQGFLSFATEKDAEGRTTLDPFIAMFRQELFPRALIRTLSNEVRLDLGPKFYSVVGSLPNGREIVFWKDNDGIPANTDPKLNLTRHTLEVRDKQPVVAA